MSVRTRVVVISCVVAAGLVGATSFAAALWRSDVTTTGRVADAAVSFDVDGTAADPAAPSVSIALGSDEAEALLATGAFARPVTVRSVSQGNRGLRYTASLSVGAGGLLHAADIAVVPVASAAACTVDVPVPAAWEVAATPVAPVYSDSTTPVTDYWCVRGELASPPDAGTFSSTSVITGTIADGSRTAQSSVPWSLDVTTALRPADEPATLLTFTYETFREGQ